jgi:SAM-dependent methyltransferase
MLRQLKRKIQSTIKQVKYRGTARYCPLCGNKASEFLAFGIEDAARQDAMCVHCLAVERHRLVWLYLNRKTDILTNQDRVNKLLHVAPERQIRHQLRDALGERYVTADLFAPDVDVKMDICDIQYPDNSFDVIYCSHVMEHVDDDLKAMREFSRVLTPEGFAIILVPITVDKTFEDKSIVTPEERTRVFGQHDHVRRYGMDIKQRLESSNLDVEVVYPKDFLSDEELRYMGIKSTRDELFICRKSEQKSD